MLGKLGGQPQQTPVVRKSNCKQLWFPERTKKGCFSWCVKINLLSFKWCGHLFHAGGVGTRTQYTNGSFEISEISGFSALRPPGAGTSLSQK